jgi:F-type H+-transporting ATPase subunit b
VELNWSTFLLEIINFLVLVWILKRFLYQPVLDVIERRRRAIDKTLADAEAQHTDARRLQERYEGRLAEWEQERRQARTALAGELDRERTDKLAELRATLKQEREKAAVVEARRRADERHAMEQQALAQGARFTTRLLEQSCGPETESRLIELVINSLARLPADRIAALRSRYGNTPEAIEVSSAFPLSGEQRRRLDQALDTVAGPNLPLHFTEDSALLAGIRITIGAWVLGANLQDELQGFRELSYGE